MGVWNLEERTVLLQECNYATVLKAEGISTTIGVQLCNTAKDWAKATVQLWECNYATLLKATVQLWEWGKCLQAAYIGAGPGGIQVKPKTSKRMRNCYGFKSNISYILRICPNPRIPHPYCCFLGMFFGFFLFRFFLVVLTPADL